MTAPLETLRFQAEAQELLGLMIHSLYKHKEIFLRELVSNSSDALDKLRFESLTRPELAAKIDELKITIEVDAKARTLSVIDNGVGMSHDELVDNLGTIARSGTRAFVQRVREAKGGSASDLPAMPALIGQFGVGFYSCFMVADEVVVETLRAGGADGASGGWRWRSQGQGEYTIEPCALPAHGTRVRLHLREKEEDAEHEGDTQDFLSEWTLRDIVKRYSDFVAYPIQMEVERDKKRSLETLNSMKPLWSRPREEITAAEHSEFYRHLTHDWEEPLETIHFKAEGTIEYTALLYVPANRPLDLFEGAQPRSKIALYVKRVMILPDCADLLPPWMRFVRGLVDAPDLPLNVSREVLQANPQVRQIKKRLTKRVIESLTKLCESDRARYQKFWSAFGTLMKEGIWLGDDEEQRISRIALFETTQGEVPTTLGEYAARMKKDQTAIWYLAGAERRALASSPHLEALAKRGEEVLLFVDPVDEWLLERFKEFDKKPLKPIDSGDLELDTQAQKQVREDLERAHRDLLSAIESQLKQDIQSVRLSTRLTDSPAVLVSEAGALSPNMERILRAAHQEPPHAKRILELNPDHAVFKRLEELHKKSPRSEELTELTELLYGQALLAEGTALPDPARFAKLLARWMVAGGRSGG